MTSKIDPLRRKITVLVVSSADDWGELDHSVQQLGAAVRAVLDYADELERSIPASVFASEIRARVERALDAQP